MKIAVKYDPYGRMGNRMFQYAFGCVLVNWKFLTERHNPEFYHPAIPNFNIHSKECKESLNNPFNTKSFGDHHIDFDFLNTYDGDIVVDSFVQKAKYYLPYRQELIKQFLPNNHMLSNDHLVVHIRETDYTLINGFLGYDYYKKLITDSGFTNIIIVTDNSTCDTVQRLVAEGCRLNTEGNVNKFEHTSDARAMADFDLLVQSKNIAISQSSFSWWAAFLGNHDKIIFPFKSEGGVWPLHPKEDEIDLYFDLGQSQKFVL